MRKILLLLLFISIPSFANDSVKLSGKITNLNGAKLKIHGLFRDVEITPASDGTFSETFEIDYTGSYTLQTVSTITNLYLEKGKHLSVTADDSNFYKSVKFGNDNYMENQYLASKSAQQEGFDFMDLMNSVEKYFLTKNESLRQNALNDYKKYKFPNTDFAKNELRALYFDDQFRFFQYIGYQSDKTPRLSADFPKFDESIDRDSESDYFFSPTYRIMTFARFSNLAYATDAKEDPSASKYPFEILKQYKSVWIKDAMMKTFSFGIQAGNPDNEKIYSDLKANVSNERLMAYIDEKYHFAISLLNGKVSPGFDYENHAGGKTKLEDLKGKYVYIDVWATWCRPCLQEIPALQKVEQQYKEKDIVFVSISVDKIKDHPKWKKMVTDKNLGGLQLISDNEFDSKFIKEYGITGIPTFILIDKEGKIVDMNAPRPSDPKLIELLTANGL